MEKVERYQCKFCGTLYDTESGAKACEQVHKTATEYKPHWKENLRVPDYITVCFGSSSEKYVPEWRYKEPSLLGKLAHKIRRLFHR